MSSLSVFNVGFDSQKNSSTFGAESQDKDYRATVNPPIEDGDVVEKSLEIRENQMSDTDKEIYYIAREIKTITKGEKDKEITDTVFIRGLPKLSENEWKQLVEAPEEAKVSFKRGVLAISRSSAKKLKNISIEVPVSSTGKLKDAKEKILLELN